MTTIPANLGRIPNLLISQLSLSNIARTNLELFRTQTQLSTGREILRPSDDAVKAATIGVLDDRVERAGQRKRNISHARSALGALDDALGDANDLALQAKEIASSQLGLGADPTTRANQGTIIGQLLDSLYTLANRKGVAGHVFGGSTPSTSPVVEQLGGYRFVGQGDGLFTDLDIARSVPITIGANAAVGTTSARVRGSTDLNPQLTPTTRLADVGGARGLGITLGTVEFSVNAGTAVRVDLSAADSVQDVADRLETAIRDYEAANTVTVLGAGGVSLHGSSLRFDMAAGQTLVFNDVSTGVTAKDLGLQGTPATSFTSGTTDSLGLNPRLTWDSPVAALAGITGALGTIRLQNAGGTADIDLSGATTLDDVRNAIHAANLGVRVLINEAGTGIDVLNELASASSRAMSISEVADVDAVTTNDLTATRLGIRTFTNTTALADFNFGRGVEIVHGQVNAATGLPDPSLDVDFKIVLGDAAGTAINVDLRPADMVSVQTLIDRINSVAGPQLTAAGLLGTDLVAGVANGSNGITLTQNAAFASPVRVEVLNNSPAAEQLGFLNSSYDAASARLTAQDRATVRVDNLFTHLIDLREALRSNDTRGIAVAAEDIDDRIDDSINVRGLVGGYAQRIEFAEKVEEDRNVVDQTIRSELRDVDFSAAAVRFSLLQTQLAAGLQTTSMAQQRSLLDFLG
jgi:flagellin-like hook-associated protein FlgL